MSINTVTVDCEACGASFSTNVLVGNFVYELRDGTQIPLDRTYGWCDACERMVAIEDLSGRSALDDLRKYKDWKLQAEDKLRRSIFFQGKEKQRLSEINNLIAETERQLAFLQNRKSPAKCLTCGSESNKILPRVPFPDKTGVPVAAGWSHPSCGGRMFATLQNYRFSMSNAPRVYDEHGLSKDAIQRLNQEPKAAYSPLSAAAEELDAQFGLTLDTIPDKRPVIELFEKIRNQADLSHEACVALLYRLVAMNYLAACKLMRDSGQDTAPEKLVWLTTLLDASIDWSEAAEDHIELEAATSQLNMNLRSFLQSFGIHAGSA